MVGHRAAVPRDLFGAGPLLLVFDEAGVKVFLEDTAAVHLERSQRNYLNTSHLSKTLEVLVTTVAYIQSYGCRNYDASVEIQFKRRLGLY